MKTSKIVYILFVIILSYQPGTVKSQETNFARLEPINLPPVVDTIPPVDTLAVLPKSVISANDTVPLFKNSSGETSKENGSEKYLKNNLKMNLSALAFNNYAFYYERSLAPRITFLAGYRYMPLTTMSNTLLAKQAFNYIETDSEVDIKSELENLKLSGNAITTEFRLYMGKKKKGARGFYFSLYGRYATYKLDYTTVYSTNDDDKFDMHVTGNGKSLSGGFGSGFQFLIAKRIVLDFYIVGVHLGKLDGNSFAAADLSSMTDEEKSGLKDDIESIKFNGKSLMTADVSDNGANIISKGPFVGIRGLGLSLGIAF